MSGAERMPRTKPKRYIAKPVGEELLVYDLERHRAHCLSSPAAEVWRRCDGQARVDEVASNVGGFDVVRLAIDDLAAADLIEGETRERRPRRDVLRSVAMAGGLAAVPMVLTLLAPTAYAQSSGTGGGDPCATAPFPDTCACGDSTECASGCCSPDAVFTCVTDSPPGSFTCL